MSGELIVGGGLVLIFSLILVALVLAMRRAKKVGDLQERHAAQDRANLAKKVAEHGKNIAEISKNADSYGESRVNQLLNSYDPPGKIP